MSVQPESAVPALPALRLLSAPLCEPPYDDDDATAPAGSWTAPPRLRLVPATPALAPRPVRRRRVEPDEDRLLRTPTAQLPPSGPFARALVQRLVEVHAGLRPLPQLQRDTTPTLYAELERHLRRRPGVPGAATARRTVLSVHVQDRPDGVAEVCATVRGEGRARALALRLEGLGGRWTCTVLLGL